jgi:hypothetical protein
MIARNDTKVDATFSSSSIRFRAGDRADLRNFQLRVPIQWRGGPRCRSKDLIFGCVGGIVRLFAWLPSDLIGTYFFNARQDQRTVSSARPASSEITKASGTLA